MKIRRSLRLIKQDLEDQEQCIMLQICDYQDLISTLEDELFSVKNKIEALEEIERFTSLKLVK